MNFPSDILSELVQNANSKDFPVLDNKYILLMKIGAGATCKVKLAKEIDTGDVVAVKILNKTLAPGISSHYQKEIDMLKLVNHVNVINLKDGNNGTIKKPDGTSKKVDYIVLEYAMNGELFDFIYFPREGLGEKFARGMFAQLLEGLDACHQAGVVHRDLKTENVMLNCDWILKIADFGFATLLAGKEGDGILKSFLGTLFYCAPEILSKKPYNGVSADIFSTGVILFVLATGQLPFGKAVLFDSTYRHFITNDYKGFWNKMTKKNVKVSEEFKSLINQLLSFDPALRPTIADIKSHPWMTQDTLPTVDEVYVEFERRKKIVNEMRELEFKKEAKKKKGNEAGSYRGDEDEAEPGLFTTSMTVSSYTEGKNPYRIKFTGSNPQLILNKIAKYFDGEDKREKTLTPDEEQAKFIVRYEIEKEILENFPELEGEKLEMQVELKMIDEENYIAEFIKLNGDKLEFVNIFDEFVTFHSMIDS